MPVAATVTVSLAGAYRHYRGTNYNIVRTRFAARPPLLIFFFNLNRVANFA